MVMEGERDHLFRTHDRRAGLLPLRTRSPPVPDNIGANAFRDPRLVLHAGFASTAPCRGPCSSPPYRGGEHRQSTASWAVLPLSTALSGLRVVSYGSLDRLRTNHVRRLRHARRRLERGLPARLTTRCERAFCLGSTLDGSILGPDAGVSHAAIAEAVGGSGGPATASRLWSDLGPLLGA